jgi:radical SAM protein with 4Fe4S-binding SPASM domain
MATVRKIATGFSRNMELFRRHADSFYRHNTFAKFANLCSMYLQKWSNRSTLSAYPFEIIIDPINICTLRCPLCPTGQRVNSRPHGKMSFERYRAIIGELSRWLYKVRFYSWGEPLLHKDIYRMIAYANESNIGTEISTNLNVFEESDAGRLLDSGLELLIISLDGLDEQTYRQYRIGGDFNKVIRNIRAIVQEKKKRGAKYPVIELQFLVMRHNEHQAPGLNRLAEELGVDRERTGPVTINIDNDDDRRWLPSDGNASRYSYSTMTDRIYSRRRKCEWLWRSTVINWDGTVAPCCVYEGRKSELGSLNGNKFIDIWNSREYINSRETFIRKINKHDKHATICSRCGGIPKAHDRKQHGLY